MDVSWNQDDKEVVEEVPSRDTQRETENHTLSLEEVWYAIEPYRLYKWRQIGIQEREGE